MITQQPSDNTQWLAFFAAWRALAGDEPVTAAHMASLTLTHPSLRDALPTRLRAAAGDVARLKKRLAYALRQRINTCYVIAEGRAIWLTHDVGPSGNRRYVLADRRIERPHLINAPHPLLNFRKK